MRFVRRSEMVPSRTKGWAWNGGDKGGMWFCCGVWCGVEWYGVLCGTMWRGKRFITSRLRMRKIRGDCD